MDVELIHQPAHAGQTGAERMGRAIAVAQGQFDIRNAGAVIASFNGQTGHTLWMVNGADFDLTTTRVPDQIVAQLKNANLNPCAIRFSKLQFTGQPAAGAESDINIGFTLNAYNRRFHTSYYT